jgi:G3E family GTPase
MARDRFVGEEVVRQLAGADLIVVTRSDLCSPAAVADVQRWLDEITGGTPQVVVDRGTIPTSVVLGAEPTVRDRRDGVAPADHGGDHLDPYVTWEWAGGNVVTRAGLDAFLRDLPVGVLRLKGFVTLDDGSTIVVQRVGERSTVEQRASGSTDIESALVAISIRDLVDPASLTRLADLHLAPA